MDCTTALMELPNGNLVRRKTWQDGEYLYAIFDTDKGKAQIQKVNIKGNPLSDGEYITIEDMGADDWEVLHTTYQIGNTIFQRTVDYVDFSIDNMITIKTKVGRKGYTEIPLSINDVRKLAKLFQDTIDAHKDLFTNDDIKIYNTKNTTWGDENE